MEGRTDPWVPILEYLLRHQDEVMSNSGVYSAVQVLSLVPDVEAMWIPDTSIINRD